ncbi:MAG: hypothetical protein R3A52_11645 [Polyangiales bacterium]
MSQIPVSELERAVLTLLSQGHGERGWHALATRLSSLDVPRSPDLMEVLGALAKRGLARRDGDEVGAWTLTPVGRMALEPGTPLDRLIASMQSPADAIKVVAAVPDAAAFAREVLPAVDLTLPTSGFPLAFALSLLPIPERIERIEAMTAGWRRAAVVRLRSMLPPINDADVDAAAWRKAVTMLQTSNVPMKHPDFVDLAVAKQLGDLAALDRWLMAAEGIAARSKVDVAALEGVFEAVVEPVCRLAITGPVALATRAPRLISAFGAWMRDDRTWSFSTRAYLRVASVFAAARSVDAEPEMHKPADEMELAFVDAAARYFRHVSENDARTLALASAALGKTEYIPRCDEQGAIKVGREREPIHGMALFEFARALGESTAATAFIEETWRAVLAHLPINVASGGARWADALWAARAVGRLRGHDLARSLADLRAALGQPFAA